MRRRRIGLDLDGVLNGLGWFNTDIKLPWWLFIGLIFVRPNKKVIKGLKKLDERDIVIVSARPKKLEGLTRAWLRFHKIPFSHLFCVGLGKGVEQRKLETLNRLEIQLFIDDDKKTVEFLCRRGINAYHVGELIE
jgi:hypothetical protein